VKTLCDIGLVILFGGFYIASVIEFDIEFFQQALVLGMDEAHGEEGELTGEIFFAAGHFGELGGFSIGGGLPFEADGFEGFQVALGITDKFFGGYSPMSVGAFFVRRGSLEDHGIGGPGHIFGAGMRGFGHELELGNGHGLLPVGGADAVAAGVTAADDDDIFVGCPDVCERGGGWGRSFGDGWVSRAGSG
jgi:hypothetical protein